MKKINTLMYLLVLITLLTALSTSKVTARAVRPASSSDVLASAKGLINPDGTLRLDGRFSGSLAMDGWSVQLDKQRGPVFTRTAPKSFLPGEPSSTLGEWEGLGSNGNGDGSLNYNVSSIAVSGTDVYVGGWFTDVNNSGTVLGAADYIAKWDGANWSALSSNGTGNGSLNGAVSSIAVSGTDVYVGGQFTDVNNSGTVLGAADYIAKWDGTNWSALGSNGAGNGSFPCCGQDIMAIAISGSNVYVGGNFVIVNNNGAMLGAADRIAKWDGTNWSALGSNGSGGGSLNFPVRAIAVSGNDVYAGGSFFDVNNNGTVLNAADHIAKWDGSNWSALGSNGSGDGSLAGSLDWVYAIAVSGGDVYVGGDFTDVNNNGTILPTADYIAKWDGSNWSALGSNGTGNGSINSEVETISVIGTDVYIGGWFWDVNNHGTTLGAADSLAKWDGANWSALGSNGSGDGSFFFAIYATALTDSNIYVGGHFDNVNNNGTVLYNADYVATLRYQTSPTFADVPFSHPLYKYIQALYDAGFTAGCSTSPLMFCPDIILDRAQSAVFMLRGQLGSGYAPPPAPWNTFADDWTGFEWAQPWAEGMWQEGLTAGCQSSPLMYCPATQLPRVEASVFGLRMKYGVGYTPPPATGTLLADMTDPTYWGASWAEQAYLDGLLPACGTDSVSGKPLFCPSELVNRGWGAYLIVKAKNLPTP